MNISKEQKNAIANFLRRPKTLMRRIERTMGVIEHLDSIRQSATATLSSMPSGGSSYDSLEKTICEMDDVLTGLSRQIADCEAGIAYVEDVLNRLSDDRYKAILSDFYMSNRTLYSISVDLNYSIEHTKRLKRNAEKELLNLIKDDTF